MQWETVIGMETHTQLSTQSKIFSGASTRFGAEPNSQASAVELAFPGTLPVLNKAAVDKAIQLGLSVGGHIAPVSVFARKNYFYPDSPKGYQISQLDTPVVSGGALTFNYIENGQSRTKTVRLTRAHLEEDAGKSLHEDFAGMTGIDLNRAGTPLLEIVSEPEMRSSAEAVAYARTLHNLVTWLGICDGNMQEGSFRCDANVSVRPVGQEAFGTRCEIKNLNSFKFLQMAIDFEVQRQIELLEDGGTVIQETRLYDPDRNETRPMRSKEDAHDYRYFPDPDLPPLSIPTSWVDRIRQEMPELPQAMQHRLVAELALSIDDAIALTQDRHTAEYFEAVVTFGGRSNAKVAANWIMGDLSSLLNREGISIQNAPVSAAQLGSLVRRVSDGTVSGKTAKEILHILWSAPSSAADAVDQVIAERGLTQISDAAALETMIDAIIAANPSQAGEYRAGKTKLFGFFVGLAMKATAGKANAQQLNALLKAKLDG